jgi:hypothetical protein
VEKAKRHHKYDNDEIGWYILLSRPEKKNRLEKASVRFASLSIFS